jgi:hypothetical protein
MATIDTSRGPVERRRLATAQPTKARLRTGMANIGNIIPIIPFAMDGCTRCDVANNPTIIRTMAPTRSDQGARLKNSHRRRTASPPPKTPPSTP